MWDFTMLHVKKNYVCGGSMSSFVRSPQLRNKGRCYISPVREKGAAEKKEAVGHRAQLSM